MAPPISSERNHAYYLPAFTARALIRELVGSSLWDLDQLHGRAELVGAEEPEAAISALIAEGYLAENPKDPGRYGPTDLGGRLYRASGTTYKRATADRALAEVIARAEEIKRNPDLMYWVNQLIVFGSYLNPEIDPVGDLDVAVGLVKKPPRPSDDEYQEWAWERLLAAPRFPQTVFEQTLWPKLEVLKALKGRSPVIQLDDAEDQILKKTATRVV